jgi:hypothetical protein
MIPKLSDLLSIKASNGIIVAILTLSETKGKNLLGELIL